MSASAITRYRSKKRPYPQYQEPEQDGHGRSIGGDGGAEDSQCWWTADNERDLHNRVMTRARDLYERHRPRREMYRFYASIYGTHEMLGLGLSNYDPASTAFIAPSLPYNVVRRGVNTLLAKITKHKPLPMVLTQRGDYRQTKRALKLTNFLSGAFDALKVFRAMRTAARDALVCGPGMIKVSHYPGDKLSRIERLQPWEVLVDAADARYGDPYQLVLLRWRDRADLRKWFPKKRAIIDKASGSSLGSIESAPQYAEQANKALTVEIYRLPVGDEDGRHVVTVEGGILSDAPWTRKTFPVAIINYAEPMIGTLGDGLAAEMAGFQYEVNYVVETLRMAQRTAGTGIWMIPDGGDIPDSHFENGVGMLLHYRQGFKPEYESPAPAHPQSYDWLRTVSNDSLAWGPGISAMSAKGEKPSGVTAAKAIQTIQDVEDDGVSVFEDNYEQLSVDIADLLIDDFKEIAAENDNQLSIMAPQKRSLMQIDWADVDMQRDAIVMQTWPTNLLGRTPAARLQMVQDLFNGGIIDRALYLKLLDAPDIDSETDLAGAMQQVGDEQIEGILDLSDRWSQKKLEAAYAKKFRPDPYQDLVYAMHRAQQHVCLGRLRGVPDTIIDILRLYIEDAKAEVEKANNEKAKQDAEAAAAAQQQQAALAGQGPGLAAAPIAPPGMAPAPAQPMAAPPPPPAQVAA